MSSWKMPPKTKIYEALTAVADERVRMLDETSAEVLSSSGDKSYTVKWSADFTQISSDDSASFWQGYLGYPIIAVLLTAGKLSYTPALAKQLSSVPWKKINDQFKRDYQKAVDTILDEVSQKGGDRDAINAEVDQIFLALPKLNLQRGGQRKKLPAQKPKEVSGQMGLL